MESNLNCSLNLPPLLRPYEFEIRNTLQEHLVRGTIDCMVIIKQNGTSKPVNINTDLIKAYYTQIETLAGRIENRYQFCIKCIASFAGSGNTNQ